MKFLQTLVTKISKEYERCDIVYSPFLAKQIENYLMKKLSTIDDELLRKFREIKEEK